MDGLLAKAARRDPEALRRLVSEHYARVFQFCARRVGPDTAQDVTQETFVTMTQRLTTFKSDSSFPTWLLGIALNKCRNHARSAKSNPLQAEDWMDAEAPSHESDVVDRQSLVQALSKLSEEHRHVVLMHEVEQLTYAEIAEVLGIPEGTVKSRLHHAFIQLRAAMGVER